jgi:ribonuclease BN (tRNA processing enzyme)
MSGFDLIALGVGDTFSEVHHPTAFLLQAEGFSLAIDCPDSYRAVLRDAARTTDRGLSLADIDDVLITHVHGDHMNGLEGVAFFKRFAQGKRVVLHTTPEAAAVLWEQRLRAPMEHLWDGRCLQRLRFEDYFELHLLAWSGESRIGPFRVLTRRTVHHVPTCALLIEHGGRTLGYSSDTAFDPSLVDFLSSADLILHETNLGPAHTPWQSLVELPQDLRRRMRLVHYPDGLEIDGIERLPQGALLRV